MTLEIDDKDKRILDILLNNSRLSYREIARMAGMSAVTVLKRVKALEKEGIIKEYSVRLDYEKIGYDMQVVMLMKVAKGNVRDVEKKVASHKNVVAVYDITGEFDTVVIARFKTRNQLNTFLKAVQAYEFVLNTQTSLVLQAIRENHITLS